MFAPRVCAVIAFALSLAAPDCRAQAPDAGQGLDQLMRRMAQRQHGHVGFVERQFIAILDRSIETSGELFFDAPDHLEKRTLKPKPGRLILDHDTLSMQRGAHVMALPLRDYPEVALFIDSIRAILAGDLAALNRTYTLAFETAGDGWRLVLSPRDAKLAGVVASIQVSGVNDAIHTVEYQRPGGDHSVMTISALSGP